MAWIPIEQTYAPVNLHHLRQGFTRMFQTSNKIKYIVVKVDGASPKRWLSKELRKTNALELRHLLSRWYKSGTFSPLLLFFPWNKQLAPETSHLCQNEWIIFQPSLFRGSSEPPKMTSYFPSYWFKVGILAIIYYNPHTTGECTHPLFTLNNQGPFFRCSKRGIDLMNFSLRNVTNHP